MARSAPPTFRNGARWYNGTSDPLDSLGLDGDYFLHTGNGAVWSKAGGTWSDTGLTIKVHDEASLARLNQANTFTAPQAADPGTMVHNTAWDGTAKQLWYIETNGSNFDVANPSGLVDGAFYTFRITHTTAHATSWGSAFKGGFADRVPTPAVGEVHFLSFQADGGNLIWVQSDSNGAA